MITHRFTAWSVCIIAGLVGVGGLHCSSSSGGVSPQGGAPPPNDTSGPLDAGGASGHSDAEVSSDGGGATSPSFTLVPCPDTPPSSDPKCGETKGAVGTGQTFPDSVTDGVGAEIQDGFVDPNTNSLVVVAGGILNGADKHAAIFRIDLRTGNRTFVSGTVLDPQKGPAEAGSGPPLLAQSAYIAAGPDGWYFVSDLNTDAGKKRGIYRIEPSTGTRTKVIADLTEGPFAQGPCKYIKNNISVAPDGKIYMPLDNAGVTGIAEITPGASPSCRAIIDNDPAAKIGTGAVPEKTECVRFAGGKVWALDLGGILYAIDTKTSNATRVSARGGSPGAGPKCLGTSGFNADESVLWTYQDDGPLGTECAGTPRVSAVDPSTGTRTVGEKTAFGPGGKTTSVSAVFPIPGQRTTLLYSDGTRILIYDMAQNLTNNFSF